MKNIFTLFYAISLSSATISQTVDFTFQSTNGSYCSPSTVRFTQTASGSPIGYVWIFGNNTGSNSENPATTYANAGTYTVRLIVIYKKHTVSVSKIIVINPGIVASFGYDRNELCAPGSIEFRAHVNEAISSYEWNFGDNTGMISTSSPVISHHFSDFAVYPISFKAIATTGCSGQSFTTISVKKPSVDGIVSPQSGCIPASVSFNATVDLPPLSTINNYLWEFGDGSLQTTTIAHTTHVYSSAGNFISRLRIVTNEGCTNDFIFPNVAFGTHPTNHIAYAKKLIFCGSESPSFVSKATNANKYFWDFGEGDTTSVSDTIVQHRFKTLGIKTVTVTPLYNDCAGSPISFTVNVIGVIAGFNYSNTCADKKTFSFTNISQGNQSSIEWNMGDGGQLMHTINVIHSFPDTGTFPARISISDNITGCSDSYFQNIYTAEPSLKNVDTSICKNSNTTFDIPANYNNPEALYSWNIIGMLQGPNNTVPLTVQAMVHGTFNNNFVIIDNGTQYCPDTIHLNGRIIVRGPILDFNANSELCVGQEYAITNLSRPYFPSDLINVWNWNYGITGHTDSVFQPLPYLFPYWGTFDVKLTATDINGCMDTLVKPVRANDIPFLRSIPDVDTLCAGQSSTLIAFHNDPIIWSSSNSLSCSSCDTVVVNPSVSTTYYVKATSRFNCSVTDSILIHVYPHFTASPVKSDNYICLNEMARLDVQPTGKIIRWSPAIGLSDSTINNPVAFPKQSTVYTAILTDSVGCFSSTTHVNVYVKSLPSVDAGPDKTYPYNANYSITPTYSSNISSYAWTPSALLSCSNCATPNGLATNTQNYMITVTSDSGCIATDKISIFVECKGANLLLPTAFTPNHDNLNDFYYPITRGIKNIVRFSIYNRQGQLVFEARDMMPNSKQSGWDGNVKGQPQASSAYVYTIEAICDVGQRLYDKGSFLLVR